MTINSKYRFRGFHPGHLEPVLRTTNSVHQKCLPPSGSLTTFKPPDSPNFEPNNRSYPGNPGIQVPAYNATPPTKSREITMAISVKNINGQDNVG
jgi:hypothetical protein